uniref:DUF6821 domain-containing protein n=2 Tax=Opuntia streptacantha TaxID=393608 RepID=A0A7C9CLU3_OPUST
MLRMDLDEWELLPSNGFIDHHVSSSSSSPNSLIDMDYFQKFIDPPQKHKICDSRVVSVVPIKFDLGIGEIPAEEKEIPEDQSSGDQIKDPKLVEKVPETYDQETISQVFFKTLKEKNEFVDMKLDSPKSVNKGFVPQIDVGTYQFDEEDEKFDEEEHIKEEKSSKLDEEVVNWEENNGGLNVWKWAMSGIGALVSFGFAAATVSLIVLGNRHKDKPSNKGQDFHFQLYNNDKRMKQVVHHATKLNEAINAVRGAPLTRAHITIGGYYEGL